MTKLQNFIHDHINQVAMLITFVDGILTQSVHDTALAGIISAVGAYLLKAITPNPANPTQPK